MALRALFLALRRLPGFVEQVIFLAYYRLPGVSAKRKRQLVIWLHEHLPILTRRTYSYQLFKVYEEFFANEREPAALAGPRMEPARAAEIINTIPDPLEVRVLVIANAADPMVSVDCTVSSLQGQFYARWRAEVMVIGSASGANKWSHEPRAGVSFLPTAAAAVERLRGRLLAAPRALVVVVHAGDQFAPDALVEAARHAVGATLVFADSDCTDAMGRHESPQLKPGYSDDLLLSTNFIGHPFFFWSDAPLAVPAIPSVEEGAWEHDFILRLAEEPGFRPVHVAKVLLSRPDDADSRRRGPACSLRAVAAAIARRGIQGTAEAGLVAGTCRVRRSLAGRPLVSIIIPFRDKPALLARCVDSILRRSTYREFEIVAIDNGSVEPATRELLAELAGRDGRIRVDRRDEPFNYSALNNHAASLALGQHLLFLNNDTEVISAGWIESMLEHSQRPEVGAVGARLLFGDGTVQHAGLVVGVGGVCEHAFLGDPGDSPGYLGLAKVIREVSAVTFACAMTRRDVYTRLGGLNARDLRVAFNDVDYCLRARELGLRVVFTPFAEMYHHESKTRGRDDSREKQLRAVAEIRYMQQRHGAVLRGGDPFYNPAFSRWDPPYSVRMDYLAQMPVSQ